jgi:hypothetical protein
MPQISGYMTSHVGSGQVTATLDDITLKQRHMSLTSILKDTNNQILRDKLKTEFARPAFNLKAEIKAAPLTNNNGIVGTAFDYLVRFSLQHHNSHSFIQRDHWVADSAYESILNRLKNHQQKEIRTGFHLDKVFKVNDLKNILTEQYQDTKKNYNDFLNSGEPTDKLIENTIFLAKLDVAVRAGIIDSTFDSHSADDIQDIKSMHTLMDKNLFTAKSKCYFNPTFGLGSVLVGGADADLIIDNTLIDIKTTKHLSLERKDLNQILGYYILSLIGGVNDKPDDRPIENIGIYFARYGELWTVPLKEFATQDKFEEVKHWLVSFMTKGEMNLDEFKVFIDNMREGHKAPKNERKTEATKKKNIVKKKARKTSTKKTIKKVAKKKAVAKTKKKPLVKRKKSKAKKGSR